MGRALGPLSGECPPSLTSNRRARGKTPQIECVILTSELLFHRLAACGVYWVLGPVACYASAGLALSFLAMSTRSLVEMEAREKAVTITKKVQ